LPHELSLTHMQPLVTDLDDYHRIRDVLARANYTDASIVAVLGVDSLSRLRDRKRPALLRRSSGRSPLHTLIRMFVLGELVEAEDARAAVAPMRLEQWVEIGLVELLGSKARGAMQLRCFQGLVLAYDFPRRGRGGLRRDHVMGVSPSSLILLGMTARRSNRSALDLGTGCGIQALFAARHSERVVAIDCNPRALATTRFNAGLNQIDNLAVRDGDMFRPVQGETFDLIVSNPPFIISPENRHLFLNSGMDGDEICRHIVANAGRFLNEDGLCLLNANWEVVDGEDWRARLAGWFHGTGCDGLVLSQHLLDLGEYAAGLIETGDGESEEFHRIFNEWMDYYAARRITSIGQGVILMTRTTTRSNWFAVDDAPRHSTFPCGEDVARLIACRAFLHSVTDDNALLDACVRLAPNVRFEQVCQAIGGAWHHVSGQLRKMGGLEYAGALDGPGALLLARCDGSRPLREQVQMLANDVNGAFAEVAPSALTIIRRLIEQGFLEPATASLERAATNLEGAASLEKVAAGL
jgi:methylase of polypeptide subunit release factors